MANPYHIGSLFIACKLNLKINEWVARILKSTTAPLDSDTVSIHARRQSVTLWRVRDSWLDRFLPSSQLWFKATGLRHADSLCCIRKPSCVNVWNSARLVFRLSKRQKAITKLDLNSEISKRTTERAYLDTNA